MDQEQMRKRTKEFRRRVIGLCKQLPSSRDGRLIGDQLFRAGTAVVANYRAACRGRSRAELIAKLGTVLEEADESQYWLELLDEESIVKGDLLNWLLGEAKELVAIFVSSLNTAKAAR